MTKNKKGFTIIEVVLVLAIAGLIFLMVFIALPALQRSQRNTRRRSDMARILAQFTEYQSNNNGTVPTNDNLNTFVNSYVGAANGSTKQNRNGSTCVGDQFCDPDGAPYQIAKYDVPTASDDGLKKSEAFGKSFSDSGHNIYYYSGASCGTTEGTIGDAGGSQDIAIFYVLEGGAIYCGDNH